MIIFKKAKDATLKHQTDKLCLNIRSNSIEVVQRTKYLGVYIDNALDWKKHIREIAKNFQGDLGC